VGPSPWCSIIRRARAIWSSSAGRATTSIPDFSARSSAGFVSRVVVTIIPRGSTRHIRQIDQVRRVAAFLDTAATHKELATARKSGERLAGLLSIEIIHQSQDQELSRTLGVAATTCTFHVCPSHPWQSPEGLLDGRAELRCNHPL
jgi:hypothetical protein